MYTSIHNHLMYLSNVGLFSGGQERFRALSYGMSNSLADSDEESLVGQN